MIKVKMIHILILVGTILSLANSTYSLNKNQLQTIQESFIEASGLLAESDIYNSYCPAPKNFYIILEDKYFEVEKKYRHLINSQTSAAMGDADMDGEDRAEAFWISKQQNCQAIHNHQVEQLDSLNNLLSDIEFYAQEEK